MSTLRTALDKRVNRVAATRTAGPHRDATSWLVLVAVGLLALLVLAPFGLVLLNAFKSPAEYSATGPLSLPSSLDFSNLFQYIERVNFGQKLMNSLITSTAIAFGATVLSLLSAYALGIGRVRGKVGILAVFLVANILPQEALIYPLFSGVQALRGTNSLIPIIVILTVLQSAFGTYLIASVLSTFPRPLIEAAQVDGASRWRTLWSIVTPIVRPTLMVLFVFIFIWSWNEFFIPLTLLTSSSLQTIPIALASLQGDRFLDPTTTAAASLISLAPTLICFLIFQRTLVRGVSVGAVK